MSNHLAIATVTAALRHALTPCVHAQVPSAAVTTLRPDLAVSAASKAALNVYLFQITPNHSLRNLADPVRSSRGDLTARPVTAYDLHYLLTVFGNDAELEPQRMLGAIVSTLHARPMLERAAIEAVCAEHYLEGSDLAEQIEAVRLSPTALDLEQLSKLWSVLFQTPYSLSVAWEASVVLLDAELTPAPAKATTQVEIRLAPAKEPRIESVSGVDGDTITAGSHVVVRGHHFDPASAVVELAELVLTPLAGSDEFLRVELPIAEGLSIGPQPVRVVQGMSGGRHGARITSTPCELIVAPRIVAAGLASGHELRVEVTIAPRTTPKQRISLILTPIAPGEAIEIPYPHHVGRYENLNFPIERELLEVHAGKHGKDRGKHHQRTPQAYLVQLRVDGLDSPLERDGEGQPIGPELVL